MGDAIINDKIKYDNACSDVTFCTMLFRIPTPGLEKIKLMDRTFETFYLPSLKQLIQTFKRLCLWCDQETATYIKKHKLDKNIQMNVLDFQDLPYYCERSEMLSILYKMKKHTGYLLHNKTPEQWLDYMILIHTKPSVIKWAAENNVFKSKYFVWLDAGSFNNKYAKNWYNWQGTLSAEPERCKFSISITLGKTRPKFMPKFIFNFFNWFKPKIQNATETQLKAQSVKSIAMINADYDVPGGCFMMPLNKVKKFYDYFEQVRKTMKKYDLVSTEQAIFQTMMKFDVYDMFELVYVSGYNGIYNAVMNQPADCLL